MRFLGVYVLALFFGACESPRAAVDAQADDAANEIDAAIDAAIDARELDAPSIDAPAIDAPPSTSPRCTTAPTRFWDVSPKTATSMRRVGNTLYLSAYELTNGGTTVENSVVVTIDLTTGTQVGPTLAVPHTLALWTSGTVVYGSDYVADGTVWRFQPGAAPVAVLEHIAGPGPVIEDAGYLYWAENASNSPAGTVKRKLLPSGAVETVMECIDARQLHIDGATIYCVSDLHISRGLKAGGSLGEGISIPDSYPLASSALDGDALYFVSLHPKPTLYRLPLFGTAAITLHQEMASGRYMGLAATSDFFYMTDNNRGIRRINRTTLMPDVIVNSTAVVADPLIWNDDLFYLDDNAQDSGTPYVMRCTD